MPAAAQFDVFISYNRADREAVEFLALHLSDAGLKPWLDTWNLAGGDEWQIAIEEALESSRACAVVVGPTGIGPWQHEEMREAIDKRVRSRGGGKPFKVIPVLLPDANRGDRSSLPRFLVATTWIEFRHSVEDKIVLQRLREAISGVVADPSAPAAAEAVCPYRGLDTFDVGDARFFFGREALVGWLLDALRPTREPHNPNRFLALVGPSGSGKSSVARAGVLAGLRSDAFEGSGTWPIAILRPGFNPIESLCVAVSEALEMEGDPSATLKFITDLEADRTLLHLAARRSLYGKGATQRLVILVDQFEELFLLCQSDETRRAFIQAVVHASTVPGGQVVVLITMRADLYGEMAADGGLAALVGSHQVLLEPMNAEELVSAIVQPAKLVGCRFEEGLVDSLVRDVDGQAGALPLLQFALAELWKRREDDLLRHESYRKLGGVGGAVQKRAEDIYFEFDEVEKEICREVFQRLTHSGEGARDFAKRVRLNELFSSVGPPDDIKQVVERLASPDARLVAMEAGPLEPQEKFVEVTHEALILGWPRLRNWLDEDREFLLWLQRLRGYIEDWRRMRLTDDVLLRGALLEEARDWQKRRGSHLNPQERDFIERSSAAVVDAPSERRIASLEGEVSRAQQRFADFQHQARSPLVQLAIRTKKVLQRAELPHDLEQELRAISGLAERTDRLVRSASLLGGAADLVKRISPESIRPDALLGHVESLVEEAQLLGRRKDGVRFEVDRMSFRRLESERVEVDARFLELALGAIIDNAVKYSYGNTVTRIHATVTREGPCVCVASTGIQIPKDEIKLVTRRGWRGKEAANATGGGSGIGLWIADEIMRAHGGKMSIRSKAESVTEVCLRLPRERSRDG